MEHSLTNIYNSTVKIRNRNAVVSFFFFLPFLDPFVFTICIFRFYIARRLVKQKKAMGGKADSDLKPEVLSSK